MIAWDIVKNLSVSVPPVKRLADFIRLSKGYDANKDLDTYSNSVFSRLLERLDGHEYEMSSWLEIGPGGNLGVAMKAVAHGVQNLTSIDISPWAQGSKIPQGLEHLDWTISSIKYLAPVNIENTDFPDESFDLIYSHACFEHFLNPDKAVTEISRLLKPGGLTVHQIDIRDHRDFSKPLRHLKYSELTWKLATSSRNCGGNRWRYSDYKNAFQQHGLLADIQITESLESYQKYQAHTSITNQSIHDLTALGLNILAKKPLL